MASLSGDTVLKLFDGTYRTIEELSKIKKSVWVHTTNRKTKQVTIALAIKPRMIGHRKDIIKVTFDDNRNIICGIDQKFLSKVMKYKIAKDFKKNDGLAPLYYKPYKEMAFHLGGINFLYKAFLTDKEYKVYSSMNIWKTFPKVRYSKNDIGHPGKHMIDYLYDFTNLHKKNYGKVKKDPRTGLMIAANHKIKKIEPLNKTIPIYTITVKENFAVDLGDNSCIFLR